MLSQLAASFAPPAILAMKSGLVIPVLALLIPVILVPTILILKFRQHRREWVHRERMKALEKGLAPPPPADGGLGNGAVIAIGAGVPAASVLSAWLTTSSFPPTPDAIPLVAVTWGVAWLISTTALVTSLVLGLMIVRSRRVADSSEESPSIAKPDYDPDAFDVVSRRG